VPRHPYDERPRPFITAFALHVEDVDDPNRYAISDIATVEGGFHRSGLELPYPEGSVLFRAVRAAETRSLK
jgi:hypothetical protein